jgi:hypothetical protein
MNAEILALRVFLAKSDSMASITAQDKSDHQVTSPSVFCMNFPYVAICWEWDLTVCALYARPFNFQRNAFSSAGLHVYQQGTIRSGIAIMLSLTSAALLWNCRHENADHDGP